MPVSYMSINDFYANREIFITGGTGFLGKALIEKLLRSCPNVGKIFLLVRSKKGKTMNERLEELSQEMVFERLHKERPNIFKEKLHAISGDCFEIGLGICEDDLKKLSNVSLIFHGAANVRFDNDLANSTLMNVRGTWELVKIAETLKNLVAFIHVSTAYVNSNDMSTNVREEKIMKIPNDWRTTIKMAETMNADTLEVLRLKFTNYFPNPYSFTKTVSEQIIEDYSDRLPMVIFRPSIVVSSLKEPVPGWLDNFYGPMGLITAAAVGILRCIYSNKNTILSVVPIDAVTRMTIVSAYKRGLETIRNRYPAPMPVLEIINCCGDIFSSFTNYQSFVIFSKYHHDQPFVNTLWAPTLKITDSYLFFLVHLLIFDIPLAATYDALLMLSKKKPMTMTILRRLVYTTKTLIAFSKRQFQFKMENLLKLNDVVPESDIDEFSLKGYIPLDAHTMFYNGFCGIKKFLLKEDVISSPKSQMRYKTFLIIDKILNCILFLIALRLFWLFLK